MADGVAVTPGIGQTIATDDAGASGHVQIIKLAISTDGSATLLPADATSGLRVHVGGLSGTVLASAVTAGLTAVALPASALSSRKALYVYNNGSVPIYVGGSAVTTSTGIPIKPGSGQAFDVATAVLYAIAGTASQNVRVLEIS